MFPRFVFFFFAQAMKIKPTWIGCGCTKMFQNVVNVAIGTNSITSNHSLMNQLLLCRMFIRLFAICLFYREKKCSEKNLKRINCGWKIQIKHEKANRNPFKTILCRDFVHWLISDDNVTNSEYQWPNKEKKNNDKHVHFWFILSIPDQSFHFLVASGLIYRNLLIEKCSNLLSIVYDDLFMAWLHLDICREHF